MRRVSDLTANLLRGVSALGAILLSAVLVSGAAHGQTLKAGEITGEILSVTATVPEGAVVDVLFVPADRTYILTQACVTGFGFAGSPVLSGTELGEILILNSSTGCMEFTPGLAFQPGELIVFTGAPVSDFPLHATALITGVMVKNRSGRDD